MASVTFPPALGGDGSTVTDDSNPTTGLANGGHRARFVPALAQMVAVANGGVTQATAQVALAAAEADAAALSEAAAAASAASAVNAPGTNATSTTSLAIGTGSKSLTVQTGKLFVPGQPVMIANTASPGTLWMAGNVTSYTSGTGALVVNVTQTSGSDTLAAWTISLAGPVTPQSVTTAQLGAATVSGVLDWNDVTNTRPGGGPTLLLGEATNGPFVGGTAGIYFHAFNLEYNTKDGTGNLTQLAIPYGNGPAQTIFMRSRFSGVWTTWRTVGGNDPMMFPGGNITAVHGRTYVLTTSVTVTLPASPAVGDWVRVINRSGTATAVIARNALNIMGLAEDMTVDDLNASFRLVFADTTRGWVLA